MSNEEALDIIRNGVVGMESHKALELAEDALQRQIPESPYNKYYCPVCDFHIGDEEGNHFIFCPMCGQRIFFEQEE